MQPVASMRVLGACAPAALVLALGGAELVLSRGKAALVLGAGCGMTAAMRSPSTTTSPGNAGAPVPSTINPFLMVNVAIGIIIPHPRQSGPSLSILAPGQIRQKLKQHQRIVRGEIVEAEFPDLPQGVLVRALGPC